MYVRSYRTYLVQKIRVSIYIQKVQSIGQGTDWDWLLDWCSGLVSDW
jgi:hypothetical protein